MPTPSMPPGWWRWKSSAAKFRRAARASAKASPIAIITVVEVVGARLWGQASATSPIDRWTSQRVARRDPGRMETPMRGRPSAFRMPASTTTSSVSPLAERRSATSPLRMRPRSPCTASAGCTTLDGWPRLERVAEIFPPTRPDLPMPETTT